MQFSRCFAEISFSIQQHLLSFLLDCGVDAEFVSSFRGFGGGKRTRTADILLAKQALYQLSYTPIDINN